MFQIAHCLVYFTHRPASQRNAMEAVVQAIKAGIMEMADIYAINKADLRGA